MPKIQARSLGWEDCLEEGVETHSSFLAWRIPWIEEPGGLWPRGLPRLEHNWNDLACINLGTELLSHILIPWGFPGGASSKESACQCRRCNGLGLDTWVGKIPWRRKCQPALVFFLGKIPWTEEPGGLQFMELQRIGHDWAESTHTHIDSVFVVLKNCQAVFHSGCTISHFHQQCMRFTVSPYPCQQCFLQHFLL